METQTTQNLHIRTSNLIEHLITLLLAVVLAMIVWLVAIRQENPLMEGIYPEAIPITVRGLSEGLQPLQDLNKESVQVTIRAPRKSWETLELDDFSAYIDLAGLDAGVHEVETFVDVVDPDVNIIERQRAELRVQLDSILTKTLPIKVSLMDSPAPGYEWQTPIVEPMSVTVKGPSTQVKQVTQVEAAVFLRNAKSQVERMQTVVVQNAQGRSVNRAEAEPPVVHVVVPVAPLPGRKEVAVLVNLAGQPAMGYRLSKVSPSLSTIVLFGDNEILDPIPGFIETEPLSLQDATSDIERRLDLRLPDGVKSLEGTSVLVRASITPIEGGITVQRQPIYQELGEGLEATVALQVVEVILSGPLPQLEALSQEDVRVVLNLSGLLPGSHTVRPEVELPEGIHQEGVLPETVEVIISNSIETVPPPTTSSSEGTLITPERGSQNE